MQVLAASPFRSIVVADLVVESGLWKKAELARRHGVLDFDGLRLPFGRALQVINQLQFHNTDDISLSLTRKGLFYVNHLSRARLHEAVSSAAGPFQPLSRPYLPQTLKIALVARDNAHG